MGQDPLDQVYGFDQGPSAQAERLRKEARGTPPPGSPNTRQQLRATVRQFALRICTKAGPRTTRCYGTNWPHNRSS